MDDLFDELMGVLGDDAPRDSAVRAYNAGHSRQEPRFEFNPYHGLQEHSRHWPTQSWEELSRHAGSQPSVRTRPVDTLGRGPALGLNFGGVPARRSSAEYPLRGERVGSHSDRGRRNPTWENVGLSGTLQSPYFGRSVGSSPTAEASWGIPSSQPSRRTAPHEPRRLLGIRAAGDAPRSRFKPPLRTAPVSRVSPPPSGTIQYSHAPPIAQGVSLLSVNILPDKYRGLFQFPLFNAVQSKCFPLVYGSDDNVVLSSPTGSGKTAILELAICRLSVKMQPGSYKIVYQAPTKALCSERKQDWEKRFSVIGLSCTELTGDTQQSQLRNVKDGDIIVTTPEKWDSMTRRWEDHRKLLEMVRLFLIDEVHILKEDRGATLEVVVSRMKSIGSDVRFIALSATVPNSADIAEWLGKRSSVSQSPAHDQRFGEEFRPVKLQKFVYGYQSPGNDFVFDKKLDRALPEVIQKHSARKPIMVFCMTRAMCISTAKVLAQYFSTAKPADRMWQAPAIQFSFKDKDLHATGACGVAFHHAGLDQNDRALVERLFLEGHLSVICCTSTLAVGVNMPTHLVVIKNTATWSNGGPKEYVDLEVMQMLGRAGRPQFDDTGVAVIMTRREHRVRYEKMVSGTEILESCLHENLVEHINAEIGLGTITNAESAKRWLRSTFLYVRLKKDPSHYGIIGERGIQDIEARLEEICERNIRILTEEGLVVVEGGRLRCSELGLAMARYYVKFGSMKTILSLQERAGLSDVLVALSGAEEFKEIRFRSGEKGLYKELNESPGMRFPVKGGLWNSSHKVQLVIQFEIGMMEFPTEVGFQKYKTSLLQDRALIFQHCHRVIRCIIDCKIYSKDATTVKAALELGRSLKAKAWENSPTQLRQIEGFGPVAIKKLVNAGIRNLEMLAGVESHKIETTLSRNPPFGANVLKVAQSVPLFRVFCNQISVSGNGKDPVKLIVKAELGLLNSRPPERFRGNLLFANFVAERSDGLLVDFTRLPVSKLDGGKTVQLKLDLETPEQRVLCHLVCEDIVGTIKTHVLQPVVDISLLPPTIIVSPPQKAHDDGADSNLVREPAGGEEEYGDAEFIAAVEDLDFSHIRGLGESLTDKTRLNTAANARMLESNTNGTRGNDVSEEVESQEPHQLPNGNWACKHRCGDKSRCKHFCCREGLEKRPKAVKSAKGTVATNSNTTLGTKPAENGSIGPENIGRKALPYHRQSNAVQKGVRIDEGFDGSLHPPKSDPPLSTEMTRLKRLHEAHGGVAGSKVRRISVIPLLPKGKPIGESASRKVHGERLSDDDDGLPTLERLLREGIGYKWCPETMTSEPKRGTPRDSIGRKIDTEGDGASGVWRVEPKLESAGIEKIDGVHGTYGNGSLVLHDTKPKDEILGSNEQIFCVPILDMNMPLDEQADEGGRILKEEQVAKGEDKGEDTGLYKDINAWDVKQEHEVAVAPPAALQVDRLMKEEHKVIEEDISVPAKRLKRETETEYCKRQRIKSKDGEDLDYVVMYASQDSIKKEWEIEGEGTKATLQERNSSEDFVIYV
ncbi:P-loop containing nucleoside triphosphate hydrolase protein [Tuber magnatum]|uniref:DNA 3'-5' helicase n=1 Tax=Tuber magnatum TaxID=42249 RepID=A0A317SVU4_9PEZI|nr:P-loop containing nucleoside triphosphate hydrolase protein [Tuber magnatum]